MLLIDAQCTILPERHQDFIRAVQKIIPLVRKEAGCARYELFSDVSDPGTFHFIEEWESRKHLDDHIAQPHMQEYFANVAKWQPVPAKMIQYEIRSSQTITIGD